MSEVTDFFGGSNTDPNAIHDNVSGEIADLTEKASPVNADLIIIEDSADSNNKKKVQAGNLPGGGASQLTDLSDVNTATTTNRNVLVADGVDFESRALVEADISDLGSYITSTGVTFENLDTNSDVGTGSSQVAAGDHDHSGTYEPADATILKQADVDDTPVNGATTDPVSSNWAYDHVNGADPHTVYKLESEMGTGASVNIHVGTSAPGSPSSGDLWVDTN